MSTKLLPGDGTNLFKQHLSGGRRQIGLWCSLASPMVTEMMGAVGFDWLLIDAEHAPNEMATLVPQLQALRGSASEPVIRTPWNDPVLIKRFMDIGFRSILFPYVQNEDEAAAAVAATRYPPRGIRGVATIHRACGYGADAGYVGTADAEACVMVQVETVQATERLEQICAIDGVDGIFIGPADLAASMGHLGNPGAPEVQALMKQCVETCRRAGKPIGTLAPVAGDARRYIEWGYSFVAVGADIGLLRMAAEAKCAEFMGV